MDYVSRALEALNEPDRFEWRAHGNGFLKTYLDEQKRVRLNLWHHRFYRADVSHLHTHPWSLSSQILIGQLTNMRYKRLVGRRATHAEGRINCQDFRGVEGNPNPICLERFTEEVYRACDIYSQRHDEIHETLAVDGTATIMTRYDAPTAGFASVFWPVGSEYGDATHHNLRPEEIEETISLTKELLFKAASA